MNDVKSTVWQATSVNNQQHPFHLVKPSPWPFLTGLLMFFLTFNLVNWFNEYEPLLLRLPYIFLLLSFVIGSWFWDITIEATFEGKHTRAVQKGLKIGFALFIVSEVMFFFSFFWAFFYIAVPGVVSIGLCWPPLGIVALDALNLPLLNTVILLSSGMVVTWVHRALTGNLNQPTVELQSINTSGNHLYRIFFGLGLTVGLGILFTSIQIHEYEHTEFAINDGIYPSLFFLLTGFHGLHVLIGTVFLFICLVRFYCGHFMRDHHIGIELAIWYWHFVDIVWLYLFIFVYYWGGYHEYIDDETVARIWGYIAKFRFKSDNDSSNYSSDDDELE